jgi:hypothetical protein
MVIAHYFSQQELIDQWLEKFPEDKNHPDLHQMALAGYVETDMGFVIYSNWELIRDQRKELHAKAGN